ncbi:MAG: hypothetical protein P1U40_11535 [Coxiellaceae bacterium]|nr:hypothetical protein [Coxiellaceae bacterium]
MQYQLPEWASSALFSNVVTVGATVVLGLAVAALIKECYNTSIFQNALIHFQDRRIKALEKQLSSLGQPQTAEYRQLWNEKCDLQAKVQRMTDELINVTGQRDAAGSFAANLFRPVSLHPAPAMGHRSSTGSTSGDEASDAGVSAIPSP